MKHQTYAVPKDLRKCAGLGPHGARIRTLVLVMMILIGQAVGDDAGARCFLNHRRGGHRRGGHRGWHPRLQRLLEC
jgi:hypothetical protein